jgi:hypothetical protein
MDDQAGVITVRHLKRWIPLIRPHIMEGDFTHTLTLSLTALGFKIYNKKSEVRLMDANKEFSTEIRNGFSPDFGEFIPETDFAKELWSLRQKAIAEGMTLLTGEEISEEIAGGRNN